MILVLAEQFQRDVAALPGEEWVAVARCLMEIPGAFRDPARHSGLGLRKLHPSGIWEVRAGLRLRLVLKLAPDSAVLLRVGDHDEVRRYLRTV